MSYIRWFSELGVDDVPQVGAAPRVDLFGDAFVRQHVAQAARDAVGDEALAPGETLQEAVHETGTEEWIDAETGGPAEGESPPHLQDE